ncbi:hypothetical protein NQZ68_020612 [Dissostichus eleginoides]|nr:hypothetical protein NQZ68_020612 [Dissostichus eleginoides]
MSLEAISEFPNYTEQLGGLPLKQQGYYRASAKPRPSTLNSEVTCPHKLKSAEKDLLVSAEVRSTHTQRHSSSFLMTVKPVQTWRLMLKHKADILLAESPKPDLKSKICNLVPLKSWHAALALTLLWIHLFAALRAASWSGCGNSLKRDKEGVELLLLVVVVVVVVVE